MRTTIIKDGIMKRLQDLLGSDKNESSKFSIQSSMMENITRICKSIVGENTNGKVMSGMTIDTNGRVSAGYAVTNSGKIIKFGNVRYANNFASAPRVNVYAVYVNVEPDVSNGGATATVIRSSAQVSIIRDQAGSSESISDGIDQCVRYDNNNTISTGVDEVYIGSIIDGRIVYPAINKSEIDYVYNTSAFDAPVWTSTTVMSSVSSKMMIDSGNNFLRKARVVIKQRTTSAYPRVSTDPGFNPANYKVGIKLVRYDTVGGASDDPQIHYIDDADKSNYHDIYFNTSLGTNCGYVGLRFIATTAAFADATGNADINFVIEKLN